MVDLSQAKSSGPERKQIELFEPIKWFPPFIQKSSPILNSRKKKGNDRKGLGLIIIFMGIAYFAVGLICLLIPFLITADGEKPDLKYAILFNIMVFPFWTTLIKYGRFEISKLNHYSEKKALHPKSPWIWDLIWKSDGITDDRWEQIFEKSGVIFLGLWFFGFASWKIFFIDWGPNGIAVWFGLFFIGLLLVYIDSILIAAFISMIYQGFQHLRYQKSKLRYQEFPFFLGGKITGQVNHLPKKFTRMTLYLRFIEESYRREGESRSRLKFFQLYKETKILESCPPIWDGTLHIDWPLPNDPTMCTALNQQPSRYWELEVKAETAGIDYRSRFLVPVYAKPNETKNI